MPIRAGMVYGRLLDATSELEQAIFFLRRASRSLKEASKLEQVYEAQDGRLNLFPNHEAFDAVENLDEQRRSSEAILEEMEQLVAVSFDRIMERGATDGGKN